MGFITMGAGGLGVLVFSMIGPLSKRFDERLLLLGLGILPMIIGRSIMFPFTGDHAPIDCLRCEGRLSAVIEDLSMTPLIHCFSVERMKGGCRIMNFRIVVPSLAMSLRLRSCLGVTCPTTPPGTT